MGFGKRTGVVIFLAIFALGLLFGTTLSLSSGSSQKLKEAKIASSVSSSFEEIPIIIELENLTKAELSAIEKLDGRRGRISKFTNPRGSVFVEFRSSGPALDSLVSSNFPSEKIVSIGDGTLRVEAHMDVSKGVAGILSENNYSLKGLARKSSAVLDSGVYGNHPDLNLSRLSAWQDFINSNMTPYDDHVNATNNVVGHGTHVLGTVAGAGVVNSSLSGVAPNSSFIALKILDYSGGGEISDIVSALSWTSVNKEIHNITSASMSLGFNLNGYIDSSIDSATNALVSSGVVAICSAGNRGELGWRMTSPAQAVKCIAVGALSDSGNLTDYTSLGNSTRQVDILAPGGSIATGLKINSTMSNSTGLADNYYHELAGTSMAAPHVTGAVQLLVQAMDSTGEPWNYSEAQALKVKMLLLMTATETNRLRENGLYNPTLNRGEPDNYEGYGRMNIDGALEAVLYNLSEDSVSSFFFNNSTTGRRVFARKVALAENLTDNFFLSVPDGMDADLYLYSASPDSLGRPQILNRSVQNQLGGNETFVFKPNFTGEGYLIAKLAYGNSGKLFSITARNLSKIFSEVNSSSFLSGAGPLYPGQKIWAVVSTYNGTGELRNSSLLFNGPCVNFSESLFFSLGTYNLSANISSHTGNCSIMVASNESEVVSSQNYSFETNILNLTSNRYVVKNIGETGNFTFYLPSEGADFEITNSTGGNVSFSKNGAGQFRTSVQCRENGTIFYNATATYGLVPDGENFTLTCFTPFKVANFSTSPSVWRNENISISGFLTSTGIDFSEGAVACSGNVLGETILNETNISILSGESLELSFAQWNATNTPSGEINASLNCSYNGFSETMNATFTIIPAYFSNLTLSDSSNVTFGRGVGIISQNTTGLALPPTFSFESAFLGSESVSIRLVSQNASPSNWTGLEWVIFSESSEKLNGSIPVFSVFLNTSMNLSNFSANFSNSSIFSAFCPETGCIAEHQEFGQGELISPVLPAYFSAFTRANSTIENATLPGNANSTENFFVSGLALLDYLNGTAVPIGAQVNWSVSPGTLNGTVQSNSSAGGNFSLNFSAPLAGNHTLNLSFRYGVSNTAYRQFNFTTSPVCGNGFCETGEIACGCSSDCGCPTTSTTIPATTTTVSSSRGSSSRDEFFISTTVTTTTPTTSVPISDPEKNAQIPGVNEQYSPNREKRENGVFETFIFQGTESKKPIELVPNLPGTPFLHTVTLSIKGLKNSTVIKIAPLQENLSLTKALIYSGFTANSTNAEEVFSALFRFSVEEAWLRSIGAHPSEVVLLRNPTGSDGWFILNATIVGTNGTHFFYNSESPGFSTFVISVLSLNSRPNSPSEESENARKEIKIGLKVPMLIFALILAFAYSIVFYAKLGWGQKRQN